MQLAAHAKINWILDIVGVSGPWHMLDMVMDTVSLCDFVDLTLRADGELTVNDVAGVTDVRRNLAYRAADALRMAAGKPLGADIVLEKHIPSGAGLAGGSSDAAAVLRGLNELWGLHYSVERLSEIALTIGSDVPYCLVGGRMRARGRGEVLSPCGGNAVYHLVLAKGEAPCPTGGVYGRYDELPAPAPIPVDDAIRALEVQDTETLIPLLTNGNDLQQPAQSLNPEVTETLRCLKEAGASAVWMTGSGAACVGLFPNETAARLADEKLDGRIFWHTYTHTQTI